MHEHLDRRIEFLESRSLWLTIWLAVVSLVLALVTTGSLIGLRQLHGNVEDLWGQIEANKKMHEMEHQSLAPPAPTQPPRIGP